MISSEARDELEIVCGIREARYGYDADINRSMTDGPVRQKRRKRLWRVGL